MTDDHHEQDHPLAEVAEAPRGADSPDSPLVRLLALAEERPLTVEDFVAVRNGNDVSR
jgi:hypothetical protein